MIISEVERCLQVRVTLPSYTCGLEMKKSYFLARFCVLTAVLLQIQSSEAVTLSRLAGISRRFGGI